MLAEKQAVSLLALLLLHSISRCFRLSQYHPATVKPGSDDKHILQSANMACVMSTGPFPFNLSPNNQISEFGVVAINPFGSEEYSEHLLWPWTV